MKYNIYIAEFLGTFSLLFAGCGAIIVNDVYPGMLGHIGISMVFGLIVMAMIYSVGNISGAHLNPAVTLGFLFAGRIGKEVVPGYIVSQIAGAFAASLVLWFFFPEHETAGATIPSIALIKAFVMEVILSFILMFVILNVSTGHMEKGIMAGVAVGGVIALEAMTGGPITGASMNPARSLAPAVISGHLNTVWIYLTAPVLGAFLAHPLCKWTQGPDCCAVEPEK